MSNTTIPTAAELRKQLEEATDRDVLEPVRKAGDEIIAKFSTYIADMLGNPKNVTKWSLFSTELPFAGYEHEEYFFKYLRSQLPKDYRVEKSHDGGGMYSTVVIRWDEEKPTLTRSAGRMARGGRGTVLGG